MKPRAAKGIVKRVQGVVSVADPLGIGERDHLGDAAHGYDDVAARAAGLLLAGGSAQEAVALMQQVFKSDWETSMSFRAKWQLSKGLQKYVIRELGGSR